MKSHPASAKTVPALPTGEPRERLERRLDDLRGLGILSPASEAAPLDGEIQLMDLAHDLADSLESTQRRVIETSIQLLSLRELVANLLTLRTPREVAETVSLYLHKAFDHELALVGVWDETSEMLHGWVAVRNGGASCYPFRLHGDWDGALRDSIRQNRFHRCSATDGAPFVIGSEIPPQLAPFHVDDLDAYVIHPLSGHGENRHRVVGVLAVGRRAGSRPIGEMDEDLLASVVDAVGTALENVLLEEEVRREEAFRQDIMRSMASGLVAVDLEGRVLTMNQSAQEMTGYSLDELRGSPPVSLDPPGGGITHLLRKTLKNREGIRRVERAVCRRGGGAFPAGCSTTPLRNPQGEVYGAVVTIENMTEIKGMEERIRSLDRLAALGRFTAGIAHEIRNPLTGIGTGVQYLARHLKDEPTQMQNLEFIQTEIVRLNRIVEDLFRVTHPHPLRKVPETVEPLLRRAIQGLGELPEQRGVAIRMDMPDDLPQVPVDPDQIQQVLLNLIKNAVEATPTDGEVRLCASASADAARPHLVIQVRDTGDGIDEAALEQIFEPFYTMGKPNGTGLGLYVSHGIVERHGGELYANNASRGGAIFSVKLPLTTYDTTETAG